MRLFFFAYMLKGKSEATTVVLEQWLLTTYNKKKAYIPNPNYEGGRKCGIWKKLVRQDYLYWEDWGCPKVLELQTLDTSLNFIQLLWNLRRFLMTSWKIIFWIMWSSRTISNTYWKLHKERYDYLFLYAVVYNTICFLYHKSLLFMKEELHFTVIILLLSVWKIILFYIRAKHLNLFKICAYFLLE